MLDTIIRNGTVVAPEGASAMDVGIVGERIAALASPARWTTSARRKASTPPE